MLWTLLACTNMSATRDAPFKLGALETALWVEHTWSNPTQGIGGATLLLVDDPDFTCRDLKAELSGDTERKDSIIWRSSGILLDLFWQDTDGENIGWKGDYYQGTYSRGSYYYYYYDYGYGKDVAGSTRTDSRTLTASVFEDGRTWSGQGLLAHAGITSGTSDSVSGTSKSSWWSAKFSAKNCGVADPYTYSYYDYR